MRKLVFTVAQGNQNATELCCRFEPKPGENPFACLERLRGALFLTGATVKSAKVVERDREWIAPDDLIDALNDPSFRH
jgi:hypothetical protein